MFNRTEKQLQAVSEILEKQRSAIVDLTKNQGSLLGRLLNTSKQIKGLKAALQDFGVRLEALEAELKGLQTDVEELYNDPGEVYVSDPVEPAQLELFLTKSTCVE